MNNRLTYIDNLRWACIMLLVPFHSAMAWNSWGEGSYVWFNANRGLSSFITLISPWYMSLLFVVAGMSAKYSLQKRKLSQFIKERLTKLLIPFITGMITVVSLMAYFADKFHNAYKGSFLSHYKVFFTTFTTLTGYDGGWTPGHLWFLLYLFIISILSAVIIALQKKYLPKLHYTSHSMAAIMIMGLFPMLMYPVLNFEGKSIGSYLVLFLIGYYIISETEVMGIIVKYRYVNLIIMIIADISDVYMFIWANDANSVLNTIVMYVTTWFGILTMLGFGKCLFNQNNRITQYLSSRSFLFYIFHFIWLVIFQYYLSRYTNNNMILFVIPIFGAYLATMLTVELIIRIPVINRLFGCKMLSSHNKNKKAIVDRS